MNRRASFINYQVRNSFLEEHSHLEPVVYSPQVLQSRFAARAYPMIVVTARQIESVNTRLGRERRSSSVLGTVASTMVVPSGN